MWKFPKCVKPASIAVVFSEPKWQTNAPPYWRLLDGEGLCLKVVSQAKKTWKVAWLLVSQLVIQPIYRQIRLKRNFFCWRYIVESTLKLNVQLKMYIYQAIRFQRCPFNTNSPLILATLASKLHIAAAGQKQLPALFGHLQNQGDPMFTPWGWRWHKVSATEWQEIDDNDSLTHLGLHFAIDS